jgi:hypothetical protein
MRISSRWLVEGATDGEGAAVQNVGVDHGRGDVVVAEKFLDGADVVAGFEQVGCKAVPEAVTGCAFDDWGFG